MGTRVYLIPYSSNTSANTCLTSARTKRDAVVRDQLTSSPGLLQAGSTEMFLHV